MADPQSLASIAEESTPRRVSRPLSQLSVLIPPIRPFASGPPSSAGSRRRRRNSSVSRVNLGFFDPNGVDELRRTLTKSPTSARPVASFAKSGLSSAETKEDEPLDFEAALRQIVWRRGAEGMASRELGVVFRNLRVQGLGATTSYQATLGSILNPLNLVGVIRALRHPPVRDILSNFEGVVRPGEMILVLGRPGAGCSTLLKILANQRQEYHAVYGNVHYDSISPETLQARFRGDVQYCPEYDVHFPSLTVEQTVSFAAATRTPRDFGNENETRKEFADGVTDMLMTIFGIKNVKNTPVGDAVVKGISGGEKKRVSIAEAMATRSLIGAWDNSTRGLDASTALEFVRALRIATDVFQNTTIISIYQAGESLYRYFDKVCIIYEGEMAYFGPADQAKRYFMGMGYEPANRQTTADFLVAVTDPSARIPRLGVSTQPRTAQEFADHFKRSKLGQLNRDDVDAYLKEYVGKVKRASAFMESARSEFAKGSRKASPYLLSIPLQVRVVMKRKVQIIMGNKLTQGLNLFSFVFQGIIVGSVFLKTQNDTGAFFSRGGILFLALIFAAISAEAEIPALYSQRPIVLRHENAALYHPFTEALALTLIDMPITIVICFVFGIILYFMTGLQVSAEQFFVFMLFLVIMAITMKAWFRGVAAAFASEPVAHTVAGISILALLLYTGYTIPKPSMIGALRWITYINPLRYGFESVLTNEFRTIHGTCSSLVPRGPGYENITIQNQVCTTVGSVPGEPFVDGNRFVLASYGFSYSNTWKNLGIVLAFCLGFIFSLLVFTEFGTSTSAKTAVIQYKRGSKPFVAKAKVEDEESSPTEKKDSYSSDISEKRSAEIKSPIVPQKDVFTWQHVNYAVPIPGQEDRQLLLDVSGYVAPNKLTAVMGASGAGKTTLLNILAQRTSTGVVTGDMLVNGQPLPRDFQAQSGYCQQMDMHLPTATVREALLFSAKLRQPPTVPLAEKETYVESCLHMCELTAYADATVGSLSMEQKKRTTIAVELAAKPKLLLFLDEPTSGLDSQSAWGIISFLRKLADNGQAILCTIHQPSAELFQVFDRLILLGKGGRTVYLGDLGHRATMLINYFERNGARACLPDENPAEYMLDVIGAGATATSQKDWTAVWRSSEEAMILQEDIDCLHARGQIRGVVESTQAKEFATSWWNQTALLVYRDAQAHWRDPNYLLAKLVLNAFGGLFIGFTFFHAENSQAGTQNKLFAIFVTSILSVPLSNQIMAPWIDMRRIYEVRERPSRMYSWTALVTSQILVELPWNILGSVILFFCWYWTVGFATSRAGYTFLMLGVVYPIYYSSAAQAVAAMSPGTEVAALIFSFLFAFVIIFNGVLQPYRQLGWWQWMYRLSPYTYLLEGLLGQAIGRQEIQCSATEFVTLNPPSGTTCGDYMAAYISSAGGYLTNPEATSACHFCSVSFSDVFLESNFNISYDHHWRNLGVMMAFNAFNILCIYLITYLFRIHTGSFLPAFSKQSTKKR